MTVVCPTVLIVDDQPALLEVFSLWLGRSGYTVLTARHGAEALEVLAEIGADVVVTDFQMPVMDGYTLLQTMAERRLALPSLFFCSGLEQIDLREAYSLGIQAILSKPIQRGKLLQTLENCLKPRTEMWLDPPSQPNAPLVEERLPGNPSAHHPASSPAFLLGRGGCAFTSHVQSRPNTTIRLHLHFPDAAAHLHAEVHVRWCSRGWLGVEFGSVAPESRQWIYSSIEKTQPAAFIPSPAAGQLITSTRELRSPDIPVLEPSRVERRRR